VILATVSNLKERLAHERFIDAKHINLELMKYAMEILDEEEREELDRKKKLAERARKDARQKGRGGILGSLTEDGLIG
jgi:hypothetical protein